MIWIIFAIIVCLILYLIFKPYFIRLNCTLLFTGEMGAGKTYTAVDKAIKAYKGRYFKIWIKNHLRAWINNLITKRNKHIVKLLGKKPNLKRKTWSLLKYYKYPRLISNIPICIKHRKNKNKCIWSNVLEKEMLTFEKTLQNELIKIPEGSVLLIDEIPQLVDQFNWDIPKVQNELNEFITFVRQYFNGVLVLTAQSESQTVKPIREKMNTFYKLSNWRKIFFFFYAVDVIQLSSSELVENHTDGFIEDNMKTTYGILHKHRYDSRCYSARYEDLPENQKYKFKAWHQYKTKRIIRFDDYISPLDPKDNKWQKHYL